MSDADRPTMPAQPAALIIEDDVELAKFFATALEKAGYAPILAESGEVAMDWLRSLKPRLVLLDLGLPDMAGENLLGHIRLHPKLSKTRVIVVTADAQRAEALRAQANLVLVKPISYAQLRDLAARLGFADAAKKTRSDRI
jgi:DNA-binding response OmpR family regulator